MADVHRRAAASAPRLTSEEIATRGFAAAFRGISEVEVRNFLKRVAAEIDVVRAREDELTAQVEELRRQLADPPLVTEDRLLDALGEETARVLRSAQESAEEIRRRAEERAAATVADAEAAAAAMREEADADAAAMRDAAQTAAAARESEATEFATELRATVAEEVATLRSETESELTAQREQSLAAAEAEIEAAKSAGRDLVNEARSVRERILADLGRRRLLLQAQIDELRVGRDRLLDAYRVVKRTMGDATEALVQVEARAAHELSGPPPPSDVPPVDGELAALAGELTGESGAPSVEVEALFARLRSQSASNPVDETPEPEPEPVPEPEPEPVPEPEPEEHIDLVAEAEVLVEPEPESESVAPEPEPEPEAGATDTDIADGPDGPDVAATSDDAARAERARVLDPLQRELGRKVKRALQDEQNDVLDRLRTVKGRPNAEDLLPTRSDQTSSLALAMRGPVDAAFAGGAAVVGRRSGVAAPASMVDGLAAAMVERLHPRLIEAIDAAGDDESAVTQRLGARYREFKGQELDAVVGDTLAAAWALGVYESSKKGAILRWVVSVEGTCPDCDDNALEPTKRGDSFPTGQLHPPAHPGCRCLVVPSAPAT